MGPGEGSLDVTMPSDEMRPIFLVGCPRSGTGILQNVLRLHPDVSWVTPATNAMTGFCAKHGLPLTLGFLAARVFDPVTVHVPRRYRPRFLSGPHDGAIEGDDKPVAGEGSRIWIWHVPERDHDRLTASDATDRARSFYRRVVHLHQQRWDAPRFLSKRPANSLRIPFLNAIFPEATFVHLVRDGAAVSASILERRRSTSDQSWWGAQPPGWREVLDDPLVAQSGWLWTAAVRTVREDAHEVLDDARYHELSYEDLTERPHATLEDLLARLDLPPEAVSDRFDPYLDQLENRNRGWQRRIPDPADHELLQETIGETLAEVGYPPVTERAPA